MELFCRSKNISSYFSDCTIMSVYICVASQKWGREGEKSTLVAAIKDEISAFFLSTFSPSNRKKWWKKERIREGEAAAAKPNKSLAIIFVKSFCSWLHLWRTAAGLFKELPFFCSEPGFSKSGLTVHLKLKCFEKPDSARNSFLLSWSCLLSSGRCCCCSLL